MELRCRKPAALVEMTHGHRQVRGHMNVECEGRQSVPEHSGKYTAELGAVFGKACKAFVDSVDRKEDRLWFLAQAGAGPIAFAVDGLNSSLLKSGRFGEIMDAPNPRDRGRSLQVSSLKSVAHMNEYGTLFTALAGLMNVVALLDAGSRPRRSRRSEAEPA